MFMKCFNFFIFFLSIVASGVWPMHSDPKTEQRQIFLVDHRSYHDDIKGEGDSRSSAVLKKATFDCDKKKREIWEKLQNGSEAIVRENKTDTTFPGEYIIKNAEIPVLGQIWQWSTEDQRENLKKIAIKIEITPTSRSEEIKNRLLFRAPILLSGICQDIALNNIGGYKGSIAGVAVGFVIGSCIHPWLDSYNSGVGKLAEKFGSKNYYQNRRGSYFAINAAWHSACAALAKLCSYQDNITYLSVRFFAYIIRAVCFCYPIQQLRKYTDPFDRTNANHTFFTLGDLAAHQGWN
jgi:hypothetical protein